MPLYEYQCSKCGRVFEVIQKFSDAPLTEHEDCGGTVERLLSAPAFHLKGSGWYVTDYGKGGGGAKKDAGSSESKTESSSSSETKSETKTETKAESKSSDSSASSTKSD